MGKVPEVAVAEVVEVAVLDHAGELAQDRLGVDLGLGLGPEREGTGPGSAGGARGGEHVGAGRHLQAARGSEGVGGREYTGAGGDEAQHGGHRKFGWTGGRLGFSKDFRGLRPLSDASEILPPPGFF